MQLNDELKELLNIILFAVPVGIVVGLVALKLYPWGARSFVIFSLNKQWKLYFFGVVLFLGLAIMAFIQDSPYFAGFFILFAALECYALFTYGFKNITPEQEARIVHSNPEKIWPFNFWK